VTLSARDKIFVEQSVHLPWLAATRSGALLRALAESAPLRVAVNHSIEMPLALHVNRLY